MGKPGVRRLLIAVTLLLIAVPWWAVGLPPAFGLPGWVVVAFGLSLVYALAVGLLLQIFWDDGRDQPDRPDHPGEDPAGVSRP